MKTKKKQLLKLATVLFALSITIGIISCKKDDNEVKTIALSTLMADDVDLNGATSPNNVAANAVITATFTSDVDAATATTANITLVRGYDNATIPLTINTSGKTVTITLSENLASGALHTLTLKAGIKSTNGAALTDQIARTFTTEGFFAPAGMMAYWNFEDNAEDQVGTMDANAAIDITYAAGRKATAGKAASFNGTTSIIEILNGDQLMTDDFTFSFWIKATNTDHPQGHFVVGLGAFYGFQFEIGGDNIKFPTAYYYSNNTDSTFSEDHWWNGDGKTKDNGGWQGTTVNKLVEGGPPTLVLENWVQIIFRYNSDTKVSTLFLNGEKALEQDFNLWNTADKQKRATGLHYRGVEPDVYNDLAFGFVQSRRGTMWDNEPWGGYDQPTANHFKGLLDDVRAFNIALSDEEITLMYNSEKP